jgi:pimeloyl-ACP methyl ester carboxylesterase
MGRLPYAAVGTGPAIVVLAGLSPTTGIGSDWMMRAIFTPAVGLEASHRVVLFNRRPHLGRGMTMAEIAAEHADAIRDGLVAPVDVIGLSTGGSVAQQLAADHPDLVHRLVLVSTACRLAANEKGIQRRVAARIRAGASRQALALMTAALIPPGRRQLVIALAAWLLGPSVIKHPYDLDDMATMIEAEDAFDLAAAGARIRARTLILAGREDRFYPQELFEETARLIPDSELRLFDRRGHVTVMNDRGFREAVASFLA